MPKLFPYQEPHVASLELALEKYNAALDASDLGTGKTICACEVARRRGTELVTVCKKVMIPTWRFWMDQFGVSGVVGNWELARKRGLPDRRGSLYVFDEVHEGAGYKTLNGRLLVNTFEAKHPLLMLSATAIESPLKMWALGYILGFHNLKDYLRWMLRNGVKRNFGYGGYHFNGSQAVLANINKRIFPERGSRMRKSEIPDFPECQFIVELVDSCFDGALDKWFHQITIRELENQQRREVNLDLDEDQEEPWKLQPSESILPEILYARMRAELSKVPAILELIKEGTANGYRTVVFVNFLSTMQAIQELAGLENEHLIWGGQKTDQRLSAITAFQANQVKVLCATIDSGGASIDLHDIHGNHPRMSIVCPTWRAVSLRQALGRVHRAGAKSKSIQKLVFLGEGIEVRVAERVREKLFAIDTINDADLAQEEFIYE